MDIDVFPPDELPLVFRVLRTALSADGPLEDAGRRFLGMYARITGHVGPLDTTTAIDADEVAVPDARRARRLVQLAAVAALLPRPVTTASAAFVAALARRLHVRDSAVQVVQALARQRPALARWHVLRRGMPALVRDNHAAGGVAGVLRFYAALLLRLPVDRHRRDDYQRLGLLPEGTLGREYWRHQTVRGFGFPGDPGGTPSAMAYHDVAHVLAGYETNPIGEIQQAAFQAGSRRRDGIFFLLFGLLQFHHSVRLTPLAKAETGCYDPERVLWALHRGARCTVDVTRDWNYWPLMPMPLHEARARCELAPMLDRAKSDSTTGAVP